MPVINQLGELYADKGLQVLGINCFDKGISVNLESRFREKGISMPLLFGENSLLQSLGVKSFPTYWLVIPGRQVEVIHGDINEVKKVLEKVFKD